MAIQLEINGYCKMHIRHKDSGKEVTEQEELEVLDNLNRGELLISLAYHHISHINSIGTPLYRYDLIPQEIEYDFEYNED